jgi:hypothetical protein
MRQAAFVFCGLMAVSLISFSARAYEVEEWPHPKDLKKCPKCPAMFDATPHPLDYRKCPKCLAGLEKAMGYVKKNFKPSMFGLLLDSFYGGFVFMMDGEDHKKELAICTKDLRAMIKPEPDGNFASGDQIGGDWQGWKKAMSMFFLTEYSLRFGLTPENKQALIDGAKIATDTEEPGGGWFHGRHKDKPYSPDIALIGAIYYAAFVEMKSLGVDPGPIMEKTRTYLESISDGKTVGYSKGWHGGMGGGGHDGFINLGLIGAGMGDDKWGQGLAGWMKQNYMDAGHGHANGELHYFAMGTALHRLGAEYYARFATCHIHRLLDIQRDDGSIPAMSHDDPNEVEFYQKHKTEIAAPGSFPPTAVLACLILMESPGAFSALPTKPVGSISNKDAFKLAKDALDKYEYGKALKNFALVLPRGDSGELVPQARDEIQKIEAIAKQQLLALRDKETKMMQRLGDKADPKEELVAYADMIKEYEKFQKDFDGSASVQEAKRFATPLQTALSNKRMRAAFSTGANAASPGAATSAKLKTTDTQKEWNEKVKERARAVVAAGGKPKFDFKVLSTRVTIQKISDDKSFKGALENGGQMDMTWTQLSLADLRSLSLDLAQSQDTPLDHALAAFFLLCSKETDKANEHLAKAGKEGASVKEAFEAN